MRAGTDGNRGWSRGMRASSTRKSENPWIPSRSRTLLHPTPKQRTRSRNVFTVLGAYLSDKR